MRGIIQAALLLLLPGLRKTHKSRLIVIVMSWNWVGSSSLAAAAGEVLCVCDKFFWPKDDLLVFIIVFFFLFFTDIISWCKDISSFFKHESYSCLMIFLSIF